MEIKIYCSECGQQMSEVSVGRTDGVAYVTVERCTCQDEKLQEEAQKQGYEDAEREFKQ